MFTCLSWILIRASVLCWKELSDQAIAVITLTGKTDISTRCLYFLPSLRPTDSEVGGTSTAHLVLSRTHPKFKYHRSGRVVFTLREFLPVSTPSLFSGVQLRCAWGVRLHSARDAGVRCVQRPGVSSTWDGAFVQLTVTL